MAWAVRGHQTSRSGPSALRSGDTDSKTERDSRVNLKGLSETEAESSAVGSRYRRRGRRTSSLWYRITEPYFDRVFARECLQCGCAGSV